MFWIAARIYVVPRLAELKPRTILLPILLLHSFRHLGLMFPAPGATYPGIPAPFAYPAAFGDLLAAVLAIAAIPAVALQGGSARFLVWLFNVVGTLDLLAAIVRYGLRRSRVHGSRVLDPGLLGSRTSRNALHHLHYPLDALEETGLTWHLIWMDLSPMLGATFVRCRMPADQPMRRDTGNVASPTQEAHQ